MGEAKTEDVWAAYRRLIYSVVGLRSWMAVLVLKQHNSPFAPTRVLTELMSDAAVSVVEV